MRRSDREIKNREEIIDVLARCDVLRLGINTTDYPYVVPMNFGYETEGQSLTIWLHCATEGRKLDLIEQNRRVGFEADCSHKLIPSETACSFTMEYESVIGFGDIYICEDDISKIKGLKAIMNHYAPGKEFLYTESTLASVCVFRLEIMQITGKRLVRK